MTDPFVTLATRLLTCDAAITCLPGEVRLSGSEDHWHAHPGEPAASAVQDLAANLRRLAGVEAAPGSLKDLLLREAACLGNQARPVAYAVMLRGRVIFMLYPDTVTTLDECQGRAEAIAARRDGAESVALYR
jgi:hypothetical protein